MKILHIGKFYPPYKGGMETYVKNICTEFSKKASVKVLVSNTTSKTVVEEVQGLQVIRCGRLFEIASTSFCPSMMHFITREEFDIIHIHSPNPMAESAIITANPKAKIVITYHSDIIKQSILLRLYMPVYKSVLGRADAILINSHEYFESSKLLQKFKKTVKVVPLGIDLTPFNEHDNIDEVEEIKKKFGDYIIFLGRLVYYKGISVLIEAMKNINSKLVIIGEGPDRKSLQQQVKKAGLEEKVTFLSIECEQSKISYLKASKLLCLPSTEKSEAFGLVQLEAMACGKPVINTSIPGSGTASVSLDSESGITVPPGDVEALSNAANKILGDAELAEKFGAAGIKRVNDCFLNEKVADQIFEIYQNILK